jgi:hypothetical protein
MNRGWQKKYILCCALSASVFLSIFSIHLNAATKDEVIPLPGQGDTGGDKKPSVGDDRYPVIQLPEKLEILPHLPDDHSHGPGVGSNDDHQPDGQSTDAQTEDGTNPAGVKLPEIQSDVAKLPLPVAKMRELIMQAARSGKIEDLRPLIGSGNDITMLSLGGIEGDPIEFFKSLSGDENGHEILAILLEVLEADYVHLDKGSEGELYVWPYFFAIPLDKLTPVQKVELFRIVTAGDYQDMQSFGGYIFYRVGITPKGRWQFFVAGD